MLSYGATLQRYFTALYIGIGIWCRIKRKGKSLGPKDGMVKRATNTNKRSMKKKVPCRGQGWETP